MYTCLIVLVFLLHGSLLMLHGLWLHGFFFVFSLHDCFLLLILICIVTEHVSYWYSMCGGSDLLNPTSLVFRFPLSCFMLSTELMSCHLVTCTMHCTCYWYTLYFNKYNLKMGETWWLTRSCRVDVGSIVSPTTGDMVVLATFPFPVSHYLYHPSGLALVSTARESC